MNRSIALACAAAASLMVTSAQADRPAAAPAPIPSTAAYPPAATLLGASFGFWPQPGSIQAKAETVADPDEQRISELVTANHILADQGVLDGFGHISVRSAKNPNHFFISQGRAPSLVTRSDIMEVDLDGRPVNPDGRKTYSEAFIHSEIYRARPDVQSVVHSHALPIVAFSASGAPFKAIFHQAFFIGSEPAPVFDSRSVPGQSTLLVANSASGAVVAKVLGQRTIVLMRGHGMAVTAPSIRGAVYEAIYAVENAQVESEALRLGAPVFLNAEEVATMTRAPGLNADRPWEQWAADARAKRSPGGAP